MPSRLTRLGKRAVNAIGDGLPSFRGESRAPRSKQLEAAIHQKVQLLSSPAVAAAILGPGASGDLAAQSGTAKSKTGAAAQSRKGGAKPSTSAVAKAKKKTNVDVERQSMVMMEEDKDEPSAVTLCLQTTLTVVFAAMLELDLELVAAMLFLPFVALFRFLSESTGISSLDPGQWMSRLSHSAAQYAQTQPLSFVIANFGVFAVLCIIWLFKSDISRWYKNRQLRSKGYDQLEEDQETHPKAGVLGMTPQMMNDPDALQHKLCEVTEQFEVVDLRIRLRPTSDKLWVKGADQASGKASALESADPIVSELLQQRAQLEETRKTLEDLLATMGATSSAQHDTTPIKANMASQGAGCISLAKSIVGILKNALNGIITVWLYFVDMISDIQVALLLWDAGAFAFSIVAGALLVLQFLAVYIRVLPYLKSTYGADSAIYLVFLWLGMPLGMLSLDFLMFLEPFGEQRLLSRNLIVA